MVVDVMATLVLAGVAAQASDVPAGHIGVRRRIYVLFFACIHNMCSDLHPSSSGSLAGWRRQQASTSFEVTEAQQSASEHLPTWPTVALEVAAKRPNS